MGIKQRECFCPWMIAYFGLQPVAEAARQCKDFADLFSKTRGWNRHKTNKRIMAELLPNHPVVKAMGFEVPQFPYYFEWVDAPNSILSNDGLKQAIAKTTEELKKEGFGVLTEIDVKETLKKKLDVDFPKYKILGACNPPFAHRALSAEPGIGLLLPCNVLVYENELGKVSVAAINTETMLKVVGRDDIQPIAREVNIKLKRVFEKI